ncbi:MAG: signal peptidase I [Chloroflexi bacterium]|nr:signal peptidase I [Chloroflexota bacterium]
MKQSHRWASIFWNIILFMGLVVIGIAFAPAQIGGQASYVMVNGISMEPNYHTGDLVIVRKAQTYQVGDVVTYRDAEMGGYVIHRIIGIEQGQVILKGDNNSWIDANQPTHDEIVGKEWFYAPKAGSAMQWLRKPINLSLTVVLLGGVLMSSMITKPKKGQKGKNSPSVNLGGMFEGTLYLLGLLFLGFLGLSIFAFTKPLTRAADNITYQQYGDYSYSAAGTPGVYDTEMVRSGEPVFPKLTCFLNIELSYYILGGQLHDISGSHQMYARVMDQQSGWQRTIPIIPQTAFTGNVNFATAALDLCQVISLLDLVEKETGLRASAYTIEIVTNIAFTANASGQVITGAFDPTLAFNFDKVHLYLASKNAERDPMHITEQGVADSSKIKANTLPILGWEPMVGFIRVFALLGLGISLSGLVIMGLFVFNTASQSEEALIRLRYGSMLVDVYERSLDVTLPMIDVTSIDDLAKMAERQNTMIMHMTLNFLHYYLVQSNGTTYRYVISAGKKGIVENDPDRDELLQTSADTEEDKFPAAKPVRLKTQRREIAREY